MKITNQWIADANVIDQNNVDFNDASFTNDHADAERELHDQPAKSYQASSFNRVTWQNPVAVY